MARFVLYFKQLMLSHWFHFLLQKLSVQTICRFYATVANRLHETFLAAVAGISCMKNRTCKCVFSCKKLHADQRMNVFQVRLRPRVLWGLIQCNHLGWQHVPELLPCKLSRNTCKHCRYFLHELLRTLSDFVHSHTNKATMDCHHCIIIRCREECHALPQFKIV